MNTIDGCVVEPCSPQVDARFMKPVEFENGPPPPLTAAMYGISIPESNSAGIDSPMATDSEEENVSESEGEGDDPYLQVFNANTEYSQGAAGPKLSDGMWVCPPDYAGGMSIVCRGVNAAETDFVTFYENGKEKRVERTFPYAIASDNGNGKLWAWTPSDSMAGGEMTIKCETNTGLSGSVTIKVTCDGMNMYTK